MSSLASSLAELPLQHLTLPGEAVISLANVWQILQGTELRHLRSPTLTANYDEEFPLERTKCKDLSGISLEHVDAPCYAIKQLLRVPKALRRLILRDFVDQDTYTLRAVQSALNIHSTSLEEIYVWENISYSQLSGCLISRNWWLLRDWSWPQQLSSMLLFCRHAEVWQLRICAVSP